MHVNVEREDEFPTVMGARIACPRNRGGSRGSDQRERRSLKNRFQSVFTRTRTRMYVNLHIRAYRRREIAVSHGSARDCTRRSLLKISRTSR